MTVRKAKKSTTKKPAEASSALSKAATHVVKEETERASLLEWLDKNDPLYDRSGAPPITISELLSSKLIHKTFKKAGMDEMPYDWSKLRGVLEARTSKSPRWFMQLREEDLLADDGFEGVTVDCVVIAEASLPTLAPAHYIVKMHLPYSDLEDNAPERILPIEGQNMCWRRVVRDDGTDINAYLLQKRESASAGISFGFGTSTTTTTTSTTVAPTTNTNTANTNANTNTAGNGFGFGFGTTTTTPSSTAGEANTMAFGFGTTAPSSTNTASTTAAPANSFSFGFGAAPTTSSSSTAAGNTNSFGFGTTTPGTVPAGTTTTTATTTTGNFNSTSSSQPVASLKPSEVLFALWSKKRLVDMVKSFKSGSRIVREDFKPTPTSQSIKLVMQNDVKDDVHKTVKQLILNKMFAKHCDKILAVDRWMDNCPVYEERLCTAMQKFRANYVQEVAEDSEQFQTLYKECHEAMEAELNRIVEIRKKIVEKELQTIEEITELLKEKKIAEKNTFRLLKYYAANDIMRFRPFGKVSGISEMGESADVCEPPAPVLVNPFAAK
ncbi:uncharacterized protein TM35_000051760 [Trypanosoma theileri]|uniref:Nucleoporin n=1 Tax=Trypanosoma theileri TaxID=67003 RepID=A0A1X0P580_9TRYP|nr:uncharacterized protein TM35_000051760 [Trypanosoma theileri]ORC91580.1 hypothetical protein TM35_000051760 [Trypanosoma theileri]